MFEIRPWTRVTYKRCLNAMLERRNYTCARDFVLGDDDVAEWYYYKTVIVKLERLEGRLIVRTGGYDTFSTKARINAVLDAIGAGRIGHNRKKLLGPHNEVLADEHDAWTGALIFDYDFAERKWSYDVV